MSIITYNRKSLLSPPLPFRFCTVCDHYAQEDRDRPQGIEAHQIFLAVDGVGELNVSGKTYHIQRGCGFFTAHTLPVGYKNKGSLVSAFLTVEGEASDALVKSYGHDFLFYDNLNTEKYLKNIRAILDGFYGGMPEGALSALAYSFYTDFFEEGQARKSPLDEVLLYIERHFAQELTLRTLAEIYRCSPSKLSHDFKEKFGVSPLRYVLDYRLDYARRLLRGEGQLTVKSIAHAAGFADASYFGRAYRERFGISPNGER